MQSLLCALETFLPLAGCPWPCNCQSTSFFKAYRKARHSAKERFHRTRRPCAPFSWRHSGSASHWFGIIVFWLLGPLQFRLTNMNLTKKLLPQNYRQNKSLRFSSLSVCLSACLSKRDHQSPVSITALPLQSDSRMVLDRSGRSDTMLRLLSTGTPSLSLPFVHAHPETWLLTELHSQSRKHRLHYRPTPSLEIKWN